MKPYAIFLFLPILIFGCSTDKNEIPKPRVYPKIEYPDKQYADFKMEDCPFVFKYPDYGQIIREENFFMDKPPHPCWFDIYFPDFNARIHGSYFPLDEGTSYKELVEDSYEIAAQINRRSDFMEEIPFSNDKDISGIVFDFEGPAASPMHFFISDTTTHFFKGALYIKSEIRMDSLQPIINFLEQDVARMIESFEWTTGSNSR